MRGGIVIVATAVLVAALTVGCDSSSESTDEQGTSPASNSNAATDPAMRGAPEAGTCRNVPPKGFARDYWFDDSPVVPCTEPHTTETVSTELLQEATVKRAKERGDSCWEDARVYVGVDLDHWVPWAALLYLPSREQVAAGARWLRCDVGFPSSLAPKPSPRTFSAVDAAVKQADILLPCMDAKPQGATPSVSCSRSHKYEATGQLAWLQSLDHYPSTKQQRRASDQCRDGLPADQQTPAFGVTAVWDPPEAFSAAGNLAGVCFVYHQDGTPLPPRN